MVDVGSGPPVILVPGVQGRWEWMRPAVKALAGRCRVISTSLAGDPGSATAFDPGLGFDAFVAQIDGLRAAAGLERAAVCGISLGGLVALRYAAERPGRVAALVLVSTPGPRWRPSPRQADYVRRPWLSAPHFVAGAWRRLGPEIGTALDGRWPRVRFTARHLARVVWSPPSPSRMGARVRLAATIDFGGTARRVQAPTLVVTGEPDLDRVVPVDGTREYAIAIAGARAVTFERTGHIGLVTRPARFAEIVGEFVKEHQRTTHDARSTRHRSC